MLIKSIKAASCHPGQVYGRGAEPSYGNAAADKAFKYLQGAIWLIQVRIRKTGYQAGSFHLRLFAYADGLVIQSSSFAPFSYKKLIHIGIKDGAQYHFAILFNSNGNTADRDAVS